jgi:hypothetical protein
MADEKSTLTTALPWLALAVLWPTQLACALATSMPRCSAALIRSWPAPPSDKASKRMSG